MGRSARACALIMAVVGVAILSAPALATTAPTDACGTEPVKADGTYWQCAFVDEFNSTRLDTTKWNVPTPFLSGDLNTIYSCAVNSPQTVSESRGALHLSAVKLSSAVNCVNGYPTTPWIAGIVTTGHAFSQTYGRFEARIRAQANVTPGFAETFWLWPDDRYTAPNWPATGEIDAGQQFSVWPNDAYPQLHYGTDQQTQGLTYQRCAAARGVWNTYAVEWTPTSISFSVNGQVCLVNTAADAAFTKPFWINLNEGLFQATSAMSTKATMDIDYVRVWR